MKQIAQTYNIASEYRTKIAYVFFVICPVLALLYAINIYKIVSNTVSIQKIGVEMKTLSASVDRLDGKYIELSSTIMPDSLSVHGMSQGHVSEYIPRSVPIGRVAMTGNEL